MTAASTVHDAISTLLTEKLKNVVTHKNLNLVVCLEIYTTIFETIVDVLQAAKVEITNESMNYLAQQYYDCVKINQTHDLDPNIFTQRAKLENIETKEIALLVMMMKGSDHVVPLLTEIKRRS